MDVGFSVLTGINIKGAFKKNLGINYKILGACNLNFIHEAINNIN